MALPLYLAMTTGEICRNRDLPAHMGYFACHFSPCGPGLSNMPVWLQERSLLILNDQLPLQGHDAIQICEELVTLCSRWSCDGVLLDFERPVTQEAKLLIQRICDALPCPVAVPEGYASICSGPVFLPAPQPDVSLEAHIALWQGREIWLELSPCACQLILNEAGCIRKASAPVSSPFFDEKLLCHYSMEMQEDRVIFSLHRSPGDLDLLLAKGESLGIARGIGLYQEIGIPAQK